MKVNFSLLLILGLICAFSYSAPTKTVAANSILNNQPIGSNNKGVIQNPNMATAANDADTNLLDALAHRFLFRSDPGRRAYLASLAADDRLFQVAYGLKRQGQYDLIRQYFHPSIQQIVLYGANSYYIMIGKTFPGGARDALAGWYLSSLRYQDNDRRDAASTYVNVHAPGWVNKQWRFVPTLSSYGGLAFYILFAKEEYTGYDGVNQKGWSLSCVRRMASDQRDLTSTYVNLHQAPIQSNTFILTPILSGDTFLISLSRDDLRLDGVDQTGWFIDVAEARKNNNDKDDLAFYVMATKNTPKYSWAIRFAQ